MTRKTFILQYLLARASAGTDVCSTPAKMVERAAVMYTMASNEAVIQNISDAVFAEPPAELVQQ